MDCTQLEVVASSVEASSVDCKQKLAADSLVVVVELGSSTQMAVVVVDFDSLQPKKFLFFKLFKCMN